MYTEPYWISLPAPLEDVRLGTMPRPRGGEWLEDELTALGRGGVDILASLLEVQEAKELGLEDEARVADEKGVRFVSCPIPDRAVPEDSRAFRLLAAELAAELRQGRSLVTHCRAGIGRSSLLAAACLCCLGMAADAALDLIGEARGRSVPDTHEQRDWLRRWAEAQS